MCQAATPGRSLVPASSTTAPLARTLLASSVPVVLARRWLSLHTSASLRPVARESRRRLPAAARLALPWLPLARSSAPVSVRLPPASSARWPSATYSPARRSAVVRVLVRAAAGLRPTSMFTSMGAARVGEASDGTSRR